MKESYDRIAIVYIPDEEIHGTVEKFGAFASLVKYQKDGIEYEELLENEYFITVDEIVFHHIEE